MGWRTPISTWMPESRQGTDNGEFRAHPFARINRQFRLKSGLCPFEARASDEKGELQQKTVSANSTGTTDTTHHVRVHARPRRPGLGRTVPRQHRRTNSGKIKIAHNTILLPHDPGSRHLPLEFVFFPPSCLLLHLLPVLCLPWDVFFSASSFFWLVSIGVSSSCSSCSSSSSFSPPPSPSSSPLPFGLVQYTCACRMILRIPPKCVPVFRPRTCGLPKARTGSEGT